MQTETTTQAPTSDVPAANATNNILAAISGSGAEPITVTVGGRQFKLRPATALGFTEREKFILSRRPSATSRLIDILQDKGLSEDQRQQAITATLRAAWTAQFASFDEIAEFDTSMTGLAFHFMQAARADQPEVDSLDKAMAIVNQTTQAEAKELLLALGLVA